MAQFGASATPRNNELLYLQNDNHHRAARLFNNLEDHTTPIKARRCDSGFWDHTDNIPERVRKYIVRAGFDGVLRTGYHKIDHALITALVERWRPETHTFHFPTGEATVTFQDVQVIWGLPVDGPAVSGVWESKSAERWASDCSAYLGFVPDESEVDGGRITIQQLVWQITHPSGNIKQRARCYILALLGGHLFSDSRSYDVSLNFLKNIDILTERGRLSWGSAVLAYLYRQLCTAAENPDVKGIQGPLILLQLWAWERIPITAPGMIIHQGVQHIYTHCVGSKWHRRFGNFSNTRTPAHVLVAYRAAFTALEEGQFIWCPYTDVLGGLVYDCRRGSGIWAYSGWLVWWCVAEPHQPNRVCRQFGFGQGVPESLFIFPARVHTTNHGGSFSGGRGTDWEKKKEAEIEWWNDRHNHVYHFDGPEGGGVLPGYMQWYYQRTVLVITNPGAPNPPNVYPQWGGVQQVQVICYVYPCEWTARGSNRNSKGLWKLAKWNPRHTCLGSVVRNNNRSLSASMIATKIGHQIKLDLTYKVKHIIATAKDHWNVDVTYCKAWNARRIAIERLYGTWENNFAELPAYIDELVQENPGTIVRWLHGPKANQNSPETFRYVFWAFGPNIQAFKHCIPYVVVDGTHLKGNYRGKLLTAVTKNANGNILPLAFAMVDNESNDSWLWFLSNFREHVAVIHKEKALCVISDRHAGLINAMVAMDDWHHRYCLRHIRSNLMTTFKDVKLKRWCWQVGTATQRRKYLYAVRQVRAINEEAIG